MGDSQRRPTVSLEAAIVARRYYLDGKQKNEVAHELGISRFKVARLLDEARDRGIVRIQVDMPTDVDLALGEKLAEAFGISRALVVQSVHGAPDLTSSLIGAAAAEHLNSILHADDVLGISWGSTLTAVVDAVHDLAPADVVQLVGGMRSAELDVSGAELVRRLTRESGGRAFALHAPLLVRSAAMARQLRADPSLEEAIERFSRLSVALVGVGSWDPARSSLYTEFSDSERSELIARGAAADVCTLVLDKSGQPLQSKALERTVGISVDELRRVPTVIATAGGIEKAKAIRAALHSRLVDVLVTDSDAARRILDLEA